MYSYTGNGAYCYANSIHMGLSAAGMTGLPEVGFLECLTTMPFGKLNMGGEFYPSGQLVEPDIGLTKALEALGWTCDEHLGGTAETAVAALRQAAARAPALVGPLDMGWLTYNPEHKHLEGADHFIIVLAVEEERLRIHDPAGYPYAVLPLDDFLQAWRAEAVGYGRKPYLMRSNFRQVEAISRAAMIARTLSVVRDKLRIKPDVPNFSYGADALCRLAADVRGEVSPELEGHLKYFALPLAARRLNDAAAFLNEGGQREAADILARQAQDFGEALYYASQQQWSRSPI
jgi:hypothetical protein